MKGALEWLGGVFLLCLCFVLPGIWLAGLWHAASNDSLFAFLASLFIPPFGLIYGLLALLGVV